MVPDGGQQAIIEAIIKSSPLWESFQLRELTHPQRDAGDTPYSNLVDLISDGTHATVTATELVCLESLTVTTNEGEAINFVFPNINCVHRCMHSQGAIITGTNHIVDALNKKILTMLHWEEFSPFSVTWLIRGCRISCQLSS